MDSILFVSFERSSLGTWESFGRRSVGMSIPGDRQMPLTRWWNKRLIRWLASTSMRVAILEPGSEDRLRGYRIGIARYEKEPVLLTACIHDRAFAVLLWREPVIVFITDPTGDKEGLLALIESRSRASAEADDIPIVSV